MNTTKPKCKTCPFDGQQKVYGEGVPATDGQVDIKAAKGNGTYDVVAVGMAPAREELQEGRPFIGVSGEILRRTFEQMGYLSYWIANTLLCQITTDDSDKIKQAASCCYNRLIAEILDKKPRLVIALGELPFHTLTDSKLPIKQAEGRIFESKVGPLLPLAHPAFYWRRPEEFFDFIECSRSGIRFLEGRYETAVEPTFTLVNHENYQEVLQKLDRHDEIACDLETTGLFPYGKEPDRIIEMGLACDSEHAYIIPAHLIQEFRGLLEEKRGVYWNAAFDAAFLKQVGISPNVHFDGMLAHTTVDERKYKHGLKRVGQIYLGAEDWKEPISEHLPGKGKKTKAKTEGYETAPPEIRHPYLAKDATRTFQLKAPLEKDMNRKVFDRMLMPACRMFIEITHRGIKIDEEKLAEMEPILTADMERLRSQLSSLIGHDLNPNSWPQVQKLIYDEMRFPVDRYYGRSTGKDAMEAFKGNPVVDGILDYREIAHTRNSYVKNFAGFLDHDGRIHPTIKVSGTVTGRRSSENPSIMNIKNESRIKEIFLADRYLAYADIKGNELRWYALVGKDEVLADILRSGGDPHKEVGIIAYGEDRADEMRRPTKTVVFGYMYRRGRDSIGRQVGYNIVDDVIGGVREVMPNLDNYHEAAVEQLMTHGYLESYFERKRRFPLVTPKTRHHMENEAINFFIQSPGGDITLLNMLHLWEIKDEWGIWPFWEVHDSITTDIPDLGLLPLLKKELEDYSLELVHGEMPFVWAMDYGIDWAMTKSEGVLA